MPKLTNQKIENIALAYVKKKYPNAQDSKEEGYDLKIGKRKVEVKGTASKNWRQNIVLSRRPEYEALMQGKKDKNYWLFRVFNVGTPKIDIKEIPAVNLKANPDPR